MPLDSAHGLIDGIEAGNRVDVYAGFNVIPLGADGRPINGGQARPMLRRILSNVPVLAVGEKGKGSTNVSLCRRRRSGAGRVRLRQRQGVAGPAAERGREGVPPGIVTVETMLLGVPPVQILRSVGAVREHPRLPRLRGTRGSLGLDAIRRRCPPARRSDGVAGGGGSRGSEIQHGADLVIVGCSRRTSRPSR